jgi:hypothetical protein
MHGLLPFSPTGVAISNNSVVARRTRELSMRDSTTDVRCRLRPRSRHSASLTDTPWELPATGDGPLSGAPLKTEDELRANARRQVFSSHQ